MNFQIGKVYNFSTRSAMLLGAKVTEAKFTGAVIAEVARRFAAIDQMYKSILPTLPEGTPISPDDTEFYIFKGQNGKEIILSSAWIVESTIELVEHVTIVATLINASVEDVEKVRVALGAAGLENFTVAIKT